MMMIQLATCLFNAQAGRCAPSPLPYLSRYLSAHITGRGSSTVGTRGADAASARADDQPPPPPPAPSLPFYVLAPSGP